MDPTSRKFDPSKQRGLWKIGGAFYDLTPFLDQHPGGRHVLEFARDRFEDSTHAFESFHLDQPRVRKTLQRYRVDLGPDPREGESPSPAEDEPALSAPGDFYAVLQARVLKTIGGTAGKGPTRFARALFWFTVAAHVALYVAATEQGLSGKLRLALGFGLVLTSGLLGGYGHNWVHQPRHFRSWAILGLDWVGFSSDDWLCHHLLQHHIYTNTPRDQHFDGTEPFFLADPARPRGFLQRLAAVLMPVVLVFGLVFHYAELVASVLLKGTRAPPSWRLLLYPAMWAFCIARLGAEGALLQFGVSGGLGVWYFTVALANHNVDHVIGNPPPGKGRHWALAQLDACADFGVGASFLSSARYLWLNYHTVHHLFPTLDMSKHPAAQQVLIETAREFNVTYRHLPFPRAFAQTVGNFYHARGWKRA